MLIFVLIKIVHVSKLLIKKSYFCQSLKIFSWLFFHRSFNVAVFKKCKEFLRFFFKLTFVVERPYIVNISLKLYGYWGSFFFSSRRTRSTPYTLYFSQPYIKWTKKGLRQGKSFVFISVQYFWYFCSLRPRHFPKVPNLILKTFLFFFSNPHRKIPNPSSTSNYKQNKNLISALECTKEIVIIHLDLHVIWNIHRDVCKFPY